MRNKINKRFILLALILCLGQYLSIHAQEQTYEIDNDRSQISFKVSHLGAFEVEGNFQKFSGQLLIDGSQLKSLKCRIVVNSIFTDNEERDRIIREQAYLDVAQFPFIEFEVTQIYIKDDQTELKGILKIKDVEREIGFPYDLIIIDEMKLRILKAKTQIKRKDFNLVFGSMNGLIGDKIDIQLYITIHN